MLAKPVRLIGSRSWPQHPRVTSKRCSPHMPCRRTLIRFTERCGIELPSTTAPLREVGWSPHTTSSKRFSPTPADSPALEPRTNSLDDSIPRQGPKPQPSGVTSPHLNSTPQTLRITPESDGRSVVPSSIAQWLDIQTRSRPRQTRSSRTDAPKAMRWTWSTISQNHSRSV